MEVFNSEFVVNILMRSLIVLTLLSLFYYFYVSNVSKTKFNNLLVDIIQGPLKNTIKEIESKDNVKDIIASYPIDKLLVLYNQESNYVKTKNGGMFSTLFTANILLWLFFIIMLFTLTYTCSLKFNLKHTIIENMVVFILFAMLQYYFYTRITSQYIPSSMTDISEIGLVRLQTHFPYFDKKIPIVF